MKETVNANIGSEAFTIDNDAYEVLKNYLADIRSRLPESDIETLGDIESRLGELFREKLYSPMQVVTLGQVQAAMNQLGAPATFGEPRKEGAPLPEAEVQNAETPLRLYRSRKDRFFAGICGGLADFSGIDVTLIRVIMVLAVFLGGLSIWVYLLFWIIIPEQPAPSFSINQKNR